MDRVYHFFTYNVLLTTFLIVFAGGNHFEGRYLHLELLFVVLVFHEIDAVHPSHFCAQVAAAGILKLFAGLNVRLQANNPFSLNFPVFAVAIKNIPMPA